jgi:SET domain-containing protein 6
MQGSRILSRSFNIPAPPSAKTKGTSTDSDDEEEDEDMVAMIPIADALNAASGFNNARLFSPDEQDSDDAEGYTMAAVTDIGSGSQIVSFIIEDDVSS